MRRYSTSTSTCAPRAKATRSSTDRKTNRWCSRVCCMYSLKLAHLLKEHTDAEIFNFYIDMRTPGKGYEEFYDKLLEEGVHFIDRKSEERRVGKECRSRW